MNLSSKPGIVQRLRRGRKMRERFVESHLAKGLAYQIRAMRDRLGWSQDELAARVGTNQNAISRLESPDYGKPTLTTLKRLAAAFDVGLIVRFVPFSEMADWVSGTPHVNRGLTNEALAVPSFSMEEAESDTSVARQQALEKRVAEYSSDYAIPRTTELDTKSTTNQEPTARSKVADFADYVAARQNQNLKAAPAPAVNQDTGMMKVMYAR